MNSSRIIVALDSKNLNKILKTIKILKKEVYAFKIGYEFFFNFGIVGYKKINKICPKIFLDLAFPISPDRKYETANNTSSNAEAIPHSAPIKPT